MLKKRSQGNLNLSRIPESQTPQRDIVCVPQKGLEFRLVVNLPSANLYVTSWVSGHFVPWSDRSKSDRSNQ